MMRLPKFRYFAPKTLDEAVKIFSGEGGSIALLAGGTDLFPNMKRRQQTPMKVIGLRNVKELHEMNPSASTLAIGAMSKLTNIANSSVVAESLRALSMSSRQVATAQIRNMATLGGNLCLDTRCNYYDQSYEWRKAIGFCMKKEGETCWVAPSSSRCWAVSSTDCAPTLLALDAKVKLQSEKETRELKIDEFFADDGIEYLTKKKDEILTRVTVPLKRNQKSAYWKMRRRGSFDFPILSVAAALDMDGKLVKEGRIVLGAVASRPLLLDTDEILVGKELTDDLIEEIAARAQKESTPLDNTDFLLSWRKKMVGKYVRGILGELRGDQRTELSRPMHS